MHSDPASATMVAAKQSEALFIAAGASGVLVVS